jgi:hypothetical protein
MRRAGWAVVVLATLAIGQAPPSDNVYVLADGTACPPQGDNPKPELKALDLQKNRAMAPNSEDVDSDVTLAAILSPGTDIDRFDGTRGATIEGIVVRVKEGSKETCNCHASQPIDRDTHIELALSDSAPATQRIVVEVTPRIRKQMNGAGTDWSTATLQGRGSADGIVGKWVRITGWLFFDEIHVKIAENTNPGGAHNVRATCWEIHPVTALQVLDGPPPGARELHPDLLAQLQRAQVKTLAQSPSLREEIARRNDSLLKKFGAEALREADEESLAPPKPEEIRKARSLLK